MKPTKQVRLIKGVKDVGVHKTSEKGVLGVAFTLEGENFAIEIKERLGAKLMLQLVGVLSSKTKNKVEAGKMETDRGTAIVADAMELIPEEDGSFVLVLEMNDIEVPIRIEAEQFAQFEREIDGYKPVELDVDEMTARKPNALEIDKRFFLRVSSGKSKIDWKFGRDQAEGLHQQIGEWLSELPPRKTH